MKQPSDHAVRRDAIDPTQSYLIQAPAGSGKTELLTDRILALLAVVKRPEEIVAITFTRKAASEMHARVLQKLQAGLGPAPTEPHKRLSWELARSAMERDAAMGWNLLEHPARLSIRTIDAFCAFLLRGMPWLSGLGGVPKVVPDARPLYEAAAQATLDMADEVPAVAEVLAHLDVDLSAARSLIADMLASRDQWLPLLGHGGDIEQIRRNLDDAVAQDIAALRAAMPVGWAEQLSPCIALAAQHLASQGQDDGLALLADWRGEDFGDDALAVQKWQALADLLLIKSNTWRRSVTIKQGFAAKTAHKEALLQWLAAMSEDDPCLPLLAGIRKVPINGYSEDQCAILSQLLQVLMLAAAQLRVGFADAGEVDFIEIAQGALQALGRADDPTDLLMRLDMSLRHILVDEFQDTSHAQIELLQRLTSGWEPGDGRTLFLVGDPMQSIYRFRKADVGGFLRVRAQGLGAVPVAALELTNNFRSQASLVEWVNRCCAPLFPKEDHPGLGAIRYTRSLAYKDAAPEPAVHFHPAWVFESPESGESRAVDSDALVLQLAQEALARHPDSAHPVAILVRARSHLGTVVHQLTRAGVPCRAVELVSLQQRQMISDLAQLARALSHPADRLAWLAVLRSPLCGLSLASLHALCGHDHQASIPSLLRQWIAMPDRVQYLGDESDALRLQHAAAVLLDESNESGSLPLAAWLQQCWDALGGPRIYPDAADAADAERFFRLVEQLAPFGNLDPDELEQQLAKLYAAPDGSGRAVEVMTIHKSKGLEFETVILAGLHREARPDQAPLMYFEYCDDQLLLGPIRPRAQTQSDPVSDYLAEREKKRASYEADRLLYVALTRAREQLHLVGDVRIDKDLAIKSPPASSLLARLWGALHLPEPPTMAPAADGRVDTPAVEPDPARYLVRRRDPSPITPSVPGNRSAPGQPWQWRSATGDESILGTVAHAWLERIGRDGLDVWSKDRVSASLPAFRRQLSRAGMTEDRLDEASLVILDTLTATLESETGRWLLGLAPAYREWSLLDAQGRVSVIDLAISQDEDWLIVDYKTTRPGPNETLSAFADRMRARHQEQMARYCAYVSALDGRPARGALYFPRVDLWVDYPATALNPKPVKML